MTFNSETFDQSTRPRDFQRTGQTRKHTPLLSPSNAWRILCTRTGGHVSRSTFYRWLDSGKIRSVRLGARMYIPWQALQDLIDRCLDGEPL